jgi:hypothetical protein
VDETADDEAQVHARLTMITTAWAADRNRRVLRRALLTLLADLE